MGKVRRGGYVFEWWIGDHPPLHIHVSDSNGNVLGRVRLDTRTSIDEWKAPRKVIEIIEELQQSGRIENP